MDGDVEYVHTGYFSNVEYLSLNYYFSITYGFKFLEEH